MHRIRILYTDVHTCTHRRPHLHQPDAHTYTNTDAHTYTNTDAHTYTNTDAHTYTNTDTYPRAYAYPNCGTCGIAREVAPTDAAGRRPLGALHGRSGLGL